MRGKPQLTQLRDIEGNLKSPYWYVKYFDGKRSQRCSTGCEIGTEDHEAQVFLAHFILERERPSVRTASELMIAVALDDYYEERGKHLTSSDNCERHIQILKSHFGNKFVSHITPSAIQGFIRERKEKVGSGTINRELAILSAALNHEVDEGRLQAAPRIKKLPAPPPRTRWLSSSEEKRLLNECEITPHLYAYAVLALNTGQRPAAIENLTWFQVDFNERMINFTHGVDSHSNKGRADVGMNDEVYKLLSKLHKTKKTGFVLEYEGKHAGCVKKAFKRACIRAGLPDVSRYTLRHTVGSKLRKSGVHMKDISEFLGHKSTTITEKHYTHGDKNTNKNTAQKLHKSSKRKK